MAMAHPSAVRPGDTIWVLGGSYRGAFTSELRGASGAPIIVRAYPGQRPILECDAYPASTYVLEVHGGYTWFWGLELISTRQQRGGERAGGINVLGPNIKFINNIIHDTGGLGIWNGSDNTEMYGNVIFDNGYEGGDRGHGHSLYLQNQNGTKRIVDNIYFNSFSHGIHIYGSENAWLDNFHIEGNFGFNNGILSGSGITSNILIGGGKPARNYNILDNVTYFTPGAYGNGRSAMLGYNGAACDNYRVQGNTFSGSPTALIMNCTNVTMTGNTILGLTSGFSQSSYPSNTYLTSHSSGATKVYIRPNQFESGRAHVAVLNWAGLGSVPVNLSGILNVGDTFEVMDAQDYLGLPVYSGVYAGGSINLTTLNTTVYRSFGNVPVPPVHTPSEFNAFVVRRTSGTPAAATRAPVVSAGSNQTITLPGTVVLNGAVTDAGYPVGTMTTAWARLSGPGNVIFANDQAAQTTASFSTFGTYVLSLTANNGTLSSTATTTITVNQAAAAPVTNSSTSPPASNPTGALDQTLRINAGGSGFTEASGLRFTTDIYYEGGSTFSAPGPITFTNRADLYNTQRYGNFTYRVPVKNGLWAVSFDFAELVFTGPGKRVFDVYINGVIVSAGYDVWARANAGRTMLNQGLSVTVTTGVLEMKFVSKVDNAIVNGIELVPVALTSAVTPAPVVTPPVVTPPVVTPPVITPVVTPPVVTPPVVTPPVVTPPVVTPPVVPTGAIAGPFRLNAGGAEYKDSTGVTWVADQYFEGGTAFSSPGPIVFTNQLPLYTTQRTGDFVYRIPVRNGLWSIQLLFAELVYTAAGKRTFDVTVNGTVVSASYDVVGRSSAARVALVQGLMAEVKNGYLEIRFKSGVSSAILNGLQLIPIRLY